MNIQIVYQTSRPLDIKGFTTYHYMAFIVGFSYQTLLVRRNAITKTKDLKCISFRFLLDSKKLNQQKNEDTLYFRLGFTNESALLG